MKDTLDLVFNIAELARLFERSRSLREFLNEVVQTVAAHLRAPVASVYLYEEETTDLVLSATYGLAPESVGQVRLRLGEGVTGLALKELRPIREARGADNPAFRFFPGIREEKFDAFLAVPILRGFARIGVLVVQNRPGTTFSDQDVKALSVIASQLASTIENTRLLLGKGEKSSSGAEGPGEPEMTSRLIKGTSASDGIAFGKAMVADPRGEGSLAAEARNLAELSLDIKDFENAMTRSEEQISRLEGSLEDRISDVPAAFIFSAHHLMLRDDQFAGKMRDLINNGVAPPEAVQRVAQQTARIFAESTSPQVREKAQDVLDLGHRLLYNLGSQAEEDEDYRDLIVIARELLPSDIVKLGVEGAAAVILLRGRPTAHIAILAQSMGLPMVCVQDEQLLRTLNLDRTLLIDAGQGNIFVDPSPDITKRYRELAAAQRQREEMPPVDDETRTLDGESVHLFATVNLCADLDVARHFKAEGIGLYRSEFPFIIRKEFPSEPEQYCVYKQVLDAMPGREVVFRTLDIGGDKLLSYFPSATEANPFLGLRAIRFSLRHTDIFKAQLRAFIRAGAERTVRIMFPMVSSLDDFRSGRAIALSCQRELKSEKAVSSDQRLLIGAMIEVPSAVEVADELAEEADFLSIGSNDLIQYLLAVDRTNERLGDMYTPCHPAVLRAIRRVAKAARSRRTPLSVCGSLAADTRMLPFLLGVGIRRLSIDARQIPRVQACIRQLDIERAESESKRLLALRTVEDVLAAVENKQTMNAEPGRGTS